VFGYKGNVVLVQGAGFSNTLTSYDAFSHGRATGVGALPPFTMWLDKFTARYLLSGPNRGQPLSFHARIRYQGDAATPLKPYDLRVNHPLNVDGARVFLLGHGYAPQFTVRDGSGRVALEGAVPFLPGDEATFTSEGVVKAPDARPAQLGFAGCSCPRRSPAATGPARCSPPPTIRR
jgi:cytochrome c biogenesis protein